MDAEVTEGIDTMRIIEYTVNFQFQYGLRKSIHSNPGRTTPYPQQVSLECE
jgi:hypothetical protein